MTILSCFVLNTLNSNAKQLKNVLGRVLTRPKGQSISKANYLALI
jgi:hypothetical protein